MTNPNNIFYEETDDPVQADRRNFYKVEKWSKDGMRVVELLFAGRVSPRRGASLSALPSTSRAFG
jgi:hypothetical protein